MIGSNGAGKSTFLNAISGDLLVDSAAGTWTVRMSPGNAAVRRLVARAFRIRWPALCEALTIEEKPGAGRQRGPKAGGAGPRGEGRAARAVSRKTVHPQAGPGNRLTDRIGLLSGCERQAAQPPMASLKPSRTSCRLDEHTAALYRKPPPLAPELTDQAAAEGK